VIIKVCGVRTPEIAEVAMDAGADWLGIVLVPDSPRYAEDAAARAVVDTVRGRVDLVGVMVDATPQECELAAQRYRLAAVQLHGQVPPWVAVSSSIPVIRAINVRDAASVLTDQWWPDCLVLLDAAPSAATGLPGGTGARVDEAVAAAVARHRPVILAGGLSAENVCGAIAAVHPYGVDASSGLESSVGVKDPQRVRAFVEAARSAAGADGAPVRR
ncbi:MAG: phosphoribosylanthranilate isomerase, partial [Candidatus Dormibacteraeota bacterium]|nr:phosphoribosylanthranilate isomerase [Candidatus Dormibacteraeota bacterium]